MHDSTVLDSTQAVFFLTAVESAGVEGSLGKDSENISRRHDNPCP
jgi:hypothetical protein